MCLTQKQCFIQYGYFPKNPLKSYLPRKANKFYLNRASQNQLIQSLGPSPRMSEPRNTMINPISNKKLNSADTTKTF